jgi:hypothetical protein
MERAVTETALSLILTEPEAATDAFNYSPLSTVQA